MEAQLLLFYVGRHELILTALLSLLLLPLFYFRALDTYLPIPNGRRASGQYLLAALNFLILPFGVGLTWYLNRLDTKEIEPVQQFSAITLEASHSSDLETTAIAPPDWHDDPFGRFPLRYYDGSEWSNYVFMNGEIYDDPWKE
ncbi:MAG: hypothetical protein HKL80_02655 [Acidimicrobiales bacterium]|nr:hypothetical protein [Acidimicrobiales bacterium]